RGVVCAQQPVHGRALVLLRTAHLRQRLAQFAVEARDEMLEPQGVDLDAVHQDHADARERIVVELADRRWRDVLPGEPLLVERNTLGVEKIEGSHGTSSGWMRRKRAR